jgi:hypothetical protein
VGTFAQEHSSVGFHLIDGDGFDVIGVNIEVQELMRQLDDEGHHAALDANAETTCDRHAYAEAVDWTPG